MSDIKTGVLHTSSEVTGEQLDRLDLILESFKKSAEKASNDKELSKSL